MDDFLHVDDGADAGDVYVSQHGEHQDGLHQQLPVLRLRDSVQYCFHVDGELNLTRSHLRIKNDILLLATNRFEYHIGIKNALGRETYALSIFNNWAPQLLAKEASFIGGETTLRSEEVQQPNLFC